MMDEIRTRLTGRRILVLEDEYMIADELARTLTRLGAEILGPVPSIAEAHRILGDGGDTVDAAVADVNLGSEMVWPALDKLLARGIPTILATGYGPDAVPAAYAHLPRFLKPVPLATLSAFLAGLPKARVVALPAPGHD